MLNSDLRVAMDLKLFHNLWSASQGQHATAEIWSVQLGDRQPPRDRTEYFWVATSISHT